MDSYRRLQLEREIVPQIDLSSVIDIIAEKIDRIDELEAELATARDEINDLTAQIEGGRS